MTQLNDKKHTKSFYTYYRGEKCNVLSVLRNSRGTTVIVSYRRNPLRIKNAICYIEAELKEIPTHPDFKLKFFTSDPVDGFRFETDTLGNPWYISSSL